MLLLLICFISDNFYILSLLKKFVNNFFSFFWIFFQRCFSGALRVNTGNPCRFKVFAAVSSAANINISHFNTHVNTFFYLFFTIFKLYYIVKMCLLCWFFKKLFAYFNWQKWKRHSSLSNGERGIWTLAPLLTPYSLSRGAPSTTWVLLQMPELSITLSQ